MKHFILTISCPVFKKISQHYFCEHCLNSPSHSHLKQDWYIDIKETNNNIKCESFKHKQRIKKLYK